MRRNLRGFAAAFALLLALAAPIAEAQKSGGILIMSHFDSPASMSMHEEATGAVNRPMMGVFNNLVMYRQDVAQNSRCRRSRRSARVHRRSRRQAVRTKKASITKTDVPRRDIDLDGG